MSQFESMNKAQLRAACKEHKIIGYGNMTTAQMREKLEAETLVAETGTIVNLGAMGEHGVDGNCPHCGIHLSNGVMDFDTLADEQGVRKALESQKHYWSCMGCGSEWGQEMLYTEEDLAALEAPSQPEPVAASKGGNGITIEKDREERNGIKRPSKGGKCAAVWEECDAYHTINKTAPKPKYMKEWATAQGLNPNNAVIEMYQWRKFMGISK